VVYLIISGLDDLAVDLLWWWQSVKTPPTPPETPAETPELHTAIFVPLWHEHQVIEQMLSHNLATVQYSRYTIFVGVYPNDQPTIDAVTRAAARLPNVRLALVPHSGPTSKADCLNWIYQQMLVEEETKGSRYETVITHDAEDIIHPQALRWINYYRAEAYDFVQIPVLALETPLFALTHGIYCDEFAENHTRDLTVRSALGAFVPSAGVGTGYSRQAREALAEKDSKQIFIPGCLTEDYENGLRLHQLGFRQKFVPILKGPDGTFVATREYFPQKFWPSVKQRTRWVTGIALQSWERNQWRGGWKTRYWFWRDRKGLIGGPLGILTTLLFLAACIVRPDWTQIPRPVHIMMAVTTTLGIYRMAFRMACVMRVYGGGMAAMAPVRILWSNWINGLATLRAVTHYVMARIQGQTLAWTKTTHEYPSRAALLGHALRLGEILVQNRIVDQATILRAMSNKPEEQRLGDYLLRIGVIDEQQLYEALALQQQLPLLAPGPLSIPRKVARALPTFFIRDWRVAPFAIDEQGIHLCTPEPPSVQMIAELERHVRLPIRFHLIPASRFEMLAAEVLGEPQPNYTLSLAAGN
jgi:adsorption protein B